MARFKLRRSPRLGVTAGVVVAGDIEAVSPATGPFDLVQSGSVAVGSALTLTGSLIFGEPFALAQSSPLAAAATSTLTGSIAFVGGTINVGTLQLDGPATPEQIALWLPTTGTVATTATATCNYRVVGAGSWTTGHPLYRVRPSLSVTPDFGGSIADGFAWTIFDLVPGTQYEVEVTVTEGAAVNVLPSLITTTRALPAAAGAVTVNVAAGSTAAQIASAINGAAAGAVIQINGDCNIGTSTITITSGGTSGSPKYIRGITRGTTITKTNIGTIFSVSSTNGHLIFENMTLAGNGVDAGASAPAYTEAFGTSDVSIVVKPRITIRNITATGIDKFVNFFDTQEMLVYDCIATGNNIWQTSPVDFLETNRAWDDDGVQLSGRGNCVFNCTLTGFGDTIAYTQHASGYQGTPTVSAHAYRNIIDSSCDDCAEFDHGRRNLTFYDNYCKNIMTCDSQDPLYGGPAIIVRNAYVNPGNVSYHKWNSNGSGWFLYNNTYISTNYNMRSDQNVGIWYTQGFDHRSYGHRNNVYVCSDTGLNTTLQMDSTTNDPVDWTHNSWVPNNGIQMKGGFWGTLAAAQSGISNSQPIFGSFYSPNNRPLAQDNITISQPFSTAVTLGANSSNNYAGSVVPTPNHASLLNTGLALPNITDGFSGAAPSRGAIIVGRQAPFYGDRNNIPDYIASMSAYDVRAMSGTYAPTNGSSSINSVTPSEWLTNDPAANDLGVVTPWCGAMKVLNGGTTKLFIHGGGHNDSANNGIYIFDYAGTTQPTGWSVKQLSAVSAVVSGGGNYSDGRPTSVHSYDGQVYASHNNCCYRFGGAYYGAASARSGFAWKYNVAADTWQQINMPIGMYGTCIYDPITRKIMVGDGSDFSQAQSVYFFNCDNNTFSAAKSISPFYLGNDAYMAWDSSRNRAIVHGDSVTSPVAISVNFANETVSASSFTMSSLTTGRAFFYDAARDVFWVFGNFGSSSITTITEVNASNGSTIATHSLSASIPVEAQHNGMFNRFSFFPEWRAIGTVASRATAAYVIKLPSA